MDYYYLIAGAELLSDESCGRQYSAQNTGRVPSLRSGTLVRESTLVPRVAILRSPSLALTSTVLMLRMK